MTFEKHFIVEYMFIWIWKLKVANVPKLDQIMQVEGWCSFTKFRVCCLDRLGNEQNHKFLSFFSLPSFF